MNKIARTMLRSPFAIAILACSGAIAALAVCGIAFGHAPGELLSILASGSIGSSFALQGTLLKSVPLLLTGLSVAIAFRAGVWNIGGEGQFLAGAMGAFLGAPYGMAAALIASILAGALWASIATAMRLWRNAPEVLTTILLNFIALHLLGYAVNGPLQEASGKYPQSDAVPAAAMLPLLGDRELHAGVIIAVFAAIAAWFLLYRTAEGLRLRAMGFNSSAARWAGINVNAQLVRAMAISGAMAGLAGGIELLGVTHRLFERFAAGYGYAGIAVALLAQLHPLGTIASAFFFGALTTGAGELQRTAGISSMVATLAQAIVILAMIAFLRRKKADS
ncbi:MAG: ral nucleoside transport system permease protein [Thermoanaerobaculia bacterium]|nr:ral nucleoside transport system permease protein [Thermoanaerobaculia bacterium]